MGLADVCGSDIRINARFEPESRDGKTWAGPNAVILPPRKTASNES